jgi:hypothetical protein
MENMKEICKMIPQKQSANIKIEIQETMIEETTIDLKNEIVCVNKPKAFSEHLKLTNGFTFDDFDVRIVVRMDRRMPWIYVYNKATYKKGLKPLKQFKMMSTECLVMSTVLKYVYSKHEYKNLILADFIVTKEIEEDLDEIWCEQITKKKIVEPPPNKYCATCATKIDKDDSGFDQGITHENGSTMCYKCSFKEEDERQVIEDDKNARERGLVEMPNGKWLQKKVVVQEIVELIEVPKKMSIKKELAKRISLLPLELEELIWGYARDEINHKYKNNFSKVLPLYFNVCISACRFQQWSTSEMENGMIHNRFQGVEGKKNIFFEMTRKFPQYLKRDFKHSTIMG